ncbi:MAG: hypothetical protein IPK76_23135 [Lewinellaceae bacterium]|nr:hypothetical protein [Lewinellaceae bacterium]
MYPYDVIGQCHETGLVRGACLDVFEIEKPDAQQTNLNKCTEDCTKWNR